MTEILRQMPLVLSEVEGSGRTVWVVHINIHFTNSHELYMVCLTDGYTQTFHPKEQCYHLLMSRLLKMIRPRIQYLLHYHSHMMPGFW